MTDATLFVSNTLILISQPSGWIKSVKLKVLNGPLARNMFKQISRESRVSFKVPFRI